MAASQKCKLILILFILSCSVSTAQNFNDALRLSQPGLYSSSRALGMGNSYIALSDDYSAVFFNPAGLGLIKRFEFAGSVNLNSFYNNTSFFDNNLESRKTQFNLNQFGLVMPVPTVKGSWVIAIGYSRIKNFNRTMEFDGFNNQNNSKIQFVTGEFNDQIPITNSLGLAYEVRNPQTDDYIRDTTLINGMLNQSGRIRKEGSIGNWSFSTSFEISKGLFLGGTFNILNGSYQSDSDFWEDDTKNIYGKNLELVPGDKTTADFKTFYMNEIIDWHLSGWDFKLGLLYKIGKLARFGATVKLPSHFNIKESFVVNASSEFGDGSGFDLLPPISDKVEYSINTPYEFSTGLSLKLHLLILSGEVKVIDYTQMEFAGGLDSDYETEQNKNISDLFRTTLNINLGAEVKIPFLPIRGRAGVIYNQSPYENDPQEFDRKYITLGAGIVFGGTVSIDGAYAHGWWKDFGDNYDVDVSRTFQDVQVDKLILTISTRF